MGKGEVEAAGLHEGDELVLDVKVAPGRKIDMSDLPNVAGLGKMVDHHDEVDWS